MADEEDGVKMNGHLIILKESLSLRRRAAAFGKLPMLEVFVTTGNAFSMCGTEQPKEQPQIGDIGSNPVAINQFLIFFFSIRFTCSRSLFSFANILYFTWLI